MSKLTMPQPPKTLNKIEDLVQIIKDLRGPDGCPWDKEQTHQSLAPYAIEETFEMVEAIENNDDEHTCEELGDVLFQVVLHANMAEERNAFKLADVIQGIAEKVVRRHPHVFSDVKAANSAEVLKNWEEIKKLEKQNKPKPKKIFDIPVGLPALQTADKIGSKTNKYQFDWSEPKQVLAQLKAEIQELEEAMQSSDADHIQHEVGDVLFSAAQLARHLNVEPESTLRLANKRFTDRFQKMTELAGSIDSFKNLSSNEKEQLWKKVKEISK